MLLAPGLPLIVDLALYGVVLLGIPRMFQVPLPTIGLFWPGLPALLYGIVALAICSAVLRLAAGLWVSLRAGPA